jgi:hypothetical protein
MSRDRRCGQCSTYLEPHEQYEDSRRHFSDEVLCLSCYNYYHFMEWLDD